MNGYSWILILYAIHLHMRKDLTIMRFGTLLVVEILIWKLYSKSGINALLICMQNFTVLRKTLTVFQQIFTSKIQLFQEESTQL